MLTVSAASVLGCVFILNFGFEAFFMARGCCFFCSEALELGLGGAGSER